MVGATRPATCARSSTRMARRATGERSPTTSCDASWATPPDYSKPSTRSAATSSGCGRGISVGDDVSALAGHNVGT